MGPQGARVPRKPAKAHMRLPVGSKHPPSLPVLAPPPRVLALRFAFKNFVRSVDPSPRLCCCHGGSSAALKGRIPEALLVWGRCRCRRGLRVRPQASQKAAEDWRGWRQGVSWPWRGAVRAAHRPSSSQLRPWPGSSWAPRRRPRGAQAPLTARPALPEPRVRSDRSSRPWAVSSTYSGPAVTFITLFPPL